MENFAAFEVALKESSILVYLIQCILRAAGL
jgi:hypothetical protein